MIGMPPVHHNLQSFVEERAQVAVAVLLQSQERL